MTFLPQTNWVDIIVVIFLIRGGYIGLNQGFSVELFKTLGTVVATVVAFLYYAQAGEWLAAHSFLSPQALNPIVFLLLFFLFIIVFKIVRMLMFKILHLGFYGRLEQWGGLILGLARSAVFASLFLFMLTLIPVEYFRQSVQEKSFSGSYLIKVAPQVLDFVVQFEPNPKEN